MLYKGVSFKSRFEYRRLFLSEDEWAVDWYPMICASLVVFAFMGCFIGANSAHLDALTQHRILEARAEAEEEYWAKRAEEQRYFEFEYEQPAPPVAPEVKDMWPFSDFREHDMYLEIEDKVLGAAVVWAIFFSLWGTFWLMGGVPYMHILLLVGPLAVATNLGNYELGQENYALLASWFTVITIETVIVGLLGAIVGIVLGLIVRVALLWGPALLVLLSLPIPPWYCERDS